MQRNLSTLGVQWSLDIVSHILSWDNRLEKLGEASIDWRMVDLYGLESIRGLVTLRRAG